MKHRPFAAVIVAAFLTISNLPSLASTNLRVCAFPGPSGRVLQKPDALGNRILDNSYVGYKGGGVPLPVVPVKVTISPVAGDRSEEHTSELQSRLHPVS